jgi:dTDP-4-amino-4,6-dideoxygalactose transaminase
MAAGKASAADFALLGGERSFAIDLPVGQLHFPSWKRYEAAMRSIFERRYYTNHGPRVQELEERLEAFLGTRHALTVSNATVGLYLVAKALGLEGKVIVPAFTFIATVQAMSWAGIDPVFCDVDPDTHHLSPTTADRALESDVTAIVAVNLWGGSSDPSSLEAWAANRGRQLLFDSAQAFGCAAEQGQIGRFGRAEVFSFHATKIVSSTEGGCISTNDDDLAERIRNMRSNYGIRVSRGVPLTINARMSEAQAAMTSMSLDDLELNRSRNERLRRTYKDCLGTVPGVKVMEPSSVITTNSQYLVCEVDRDHFGMSRDSLLSVLKSEGVAARRYFYPGAHRTAPYSTTHRQYRDVLHSTDAISAKVLQLPVGSLVTEDEAERISQLVRDARAFAPALLSALDDRVTSTGLLTRPKETF